MRQVNAAHLAAGISPFNGFATELLRSDALLALLDLSIRHRTAVPAVLAIIVSLVTEGALQNLCEAGVSKFVMRYCGEEDCKTSCTEIVHMILHKCQHMMHGEQSIDVYETVATVLADISTGTLITVTVFHPY